MNEYITKIKNNIFSPEGKKEVLINLITLFITYISLYILIQSRFETNYMINIFLAIITGITAWIILHFKFKVPFI